MVRGAGADPAPFLQQGILQLVVDGITRFAEDLPLVTEGYWVLAYLTAGSNPAVVAELLRLGVAPLLSAHMQAACGGGGGGGGVGSEDDCDNCMYVTPMLRVVGNCIASQSIAAAAAAAAMGTGIAAAAAAVGGGSSGSGGAAVQDSSTSAYPGVAVAAGAGVGASTTAATATATATPAAVLLADRAIPQCLLHCLASPLSHVVLEATWVVSTIAGGAPAHAAGLVQIGVLSPLIAVLTGTWNAYLRYICHQSVLLVHLGGGGGGETNCLLHCRLVGGRTGHDLLGGPSSACATEEHACVWLCMGRSLCGCVVVWLCGCVECEICRALERACARASV